MLYRVTFFIGLMLVSPAALADMPYWNVTVTCDANLREARIAAELCYQQLDGSGTNYRGEPCRGNHEAQISEDRRVVSVLARGGRQLHTALRAEPDEVHFISNHPSEFSCKMPNSELGDGSAGGQIFVRIDRYPSTFNWGGQCGTAPYDASLLVQTGTTQLSIEQSAERILLIDNCDGDALNYALFTTINADTGEIVIQRGSPIQIR